MIINYYVIIDPSGIFKNDLKAEHFQLFIYCILFMYIIPTIISLFLYLLYIIVFKKKDITENENERKVRIIDFFGYLIYIEQKKNQTEKMKCELCQRLYYNLYTCVQKLFDPLFDYCCCCLDWLYGDCHCCCFDYIDCNCCNCCEQFDDDYKSKEVFCYCYKYTGKLSWFFNFLSNEHQILIIVVSCINFYLQFMTIGLIKKINVEIVNQPFKISNSHFLTYFFTFILYLLFSHIVSIIIEKCCIDEPDDDDFKKKF
jgi:hypothetical protein